MISELVPTCPKETLDFKQDFHFRPYSMFYLLSVEILQNRVFLQNDSNSF